MGFFWWRKNLRSACCPSENRGKIERGFVRGLDDDALSIRVKQRSSIVDHIPYTFPVGQADAAHVVRGRVTVKHSEKMCFKVVYGMSMLI